MLPEWFDKAVEMYNNDYSFLQIGRELNVDRKKISKVLANNGYEAKYSFKTTGGVNREFKPWRKVKVDEDYFENINTEDKSYWLGFLYADGYVSHTGTTLELGLCEKDYSHLVKFRNSLNCDYKIIKKIKNTKDKGYIGYRISVNSKKMCNDLIDKGCLQNKSNILKFPTSDQVPTELLKHFIRGYVDGDGSVSTSNKGKQLRLDIIGTKDMLDGIIKSLNVKKNNYAICNTRAKVINYNILVTQWSGKYANDIAEKLYLNCNICLDRKYEKAMQFICPTNSTSTEELV